MPESPKVNEQIAELTRERNMRHHVYPGLIAKGKMKPAQAQYSNQCLEAAIRTLEYMREHREVIIAAVALSKKDAA